MLQQLASLHMRIPRQNTSVLLPTEQRQHQIRLKRWGKSYPLPQELSPGPLPSVMNYRGTPLRGVRTISIKHNFLMKRSRGSPVELIRMECSLKPLQGRELDTWSSLDWKAEALGWSEVLTSLQIPPVVLNVLLLVPEAEPGAPPKKTAVIIFIINCLQDEQASLLKPV